MRYIAAAALIILLLIIFSACSQKDVKEPDEPADAAVYHKISQKVAKEMMDDEGVLIIDVREQSEYDAGHIENAILLPVGSITDTIGKTAPDKGTVLLIYCRSGNRSRTAANKLVKMGYTEVYDFGGINTWPYGIVK